MIVTVNLVNELISKTPRLNSKMGSKVLSAAVTTDAVTVESITH